MKMLKAPDLPNITSPSVSIDVIETSYWIATEYLKTHVCLFVWEKYKRHNSWSVSTWCKRVQYKTIMSEGTATNKSNLPPPTYHNAKRKNSNVDNDVNEQL